MTKPNAKRRLLTEGESSLALAFACVAFFGAGIGFMTVSRINDFSFFSRPFTLYENWIVLSGALGTAIALFLAGERVGQMGPRGHLQGAVSVIWVSVVAAIIAGTLALPIYGTMFGPFLVAGTLVDQPLLAAFWSISLFGAHLLIGRWRRERDTILHDRTETMGIRAART